MEFTIEYVQEPSGAVPALEFIQKQDEKAQAAIFAHLDRLAVHGQRMPGKLVEKLTDSIFELRVKHFDRLYRVLWFYSKGQVIVVTSAFQKKGRKTPKAEIERAERLREQWTKGR